MRRVLGALLLVGAVAPWRPAVLPAPLLPNSPDSQKFAVIGDHGSGARPQYELADQMRIARQGFPFELVVTVGDVFYGSQKPADRVKKFELPYKALLDSGVTFRAALGNHDATDTVHYPPLNMAGQRYYTFAERRIRFFVLDTNVLDPPQLRWFESALAAAQEPWKIAVFHHPLYGNAGRHGSNVDLRVLLEPLLVKGGVQVVFSGHDHVYERLRPQRGIHYFVVGSSGQLRKGDLQRAATTAAGFDRDQVFLLAEVEGDLLHFEAISRTGDIVDGGVIARAAALTSRE